MCEPGAASTIAVHVSSSSAAGTLQFGELGVRFTALGVAPSMPIVSDCVAGDTYLRVRALLAAILRGTIIVICAVALPLPVFAAFAGAVVGVVVGRNIEVVPELAHPARSTSVVQNAARKNAVLRKPLVTRVQPDLYEPERGDRAGTGKGSPVFSSCLNDSLLRLRAASGLYDSDRVAARSGRSPSTIKNQTINIYRTLGVNRRAALVALVMGEK